MTDGAVRNALSTAWHVIESNKPSSSLATSACNAVPAELPDVAALTGAQGPNGVRWRLLMANAFDAYVVDIAFDLRWEYGARYHGGGAFITDCYLYVPRCKVLWGFEVDAAVHVHPPDNAGTASAPLARLPLTVSGSVRTLFDTHQLRWDFVLYGDGGYRTG
jgi:hypothetical protein